MKNFIFIILISILSMGCSSSPSGTEIPPTNGEATVNVNFNWNDVSNPPSERFSDQNSNLQSIRDATDFGIRIEYLSDDATFTQSVSNTDGDSTGLITLDIPTADSVAVYAIAVDETHVINMGVIKTAVINNATSYDFTVNDFKWEAPSWGAGPDFEPNGWNTAYAATSTARAKIEFDVVNPYDRPELDPDENYDNFVMKVQGNGGISQHKGNDIREYYINVDNPNPGTVDTVETRWNPYVDGDMFNLPAGRYIVDQNGLFQVIFNE